MDTLKSLLSLQNYSDKKAKYLSGGNKRKVCQAMALMRAPRIIFMDEPSNGVDPVSRRNLYSYLRSLKDTSTLIITHRIDEAEKICNKLAIMVKGRFVDLDSPSKLKEKHGTVYMIQIQPAKTSAAQVEGFHFRIIEKLPFCTRIEHENEDTDFHVTVRPKQTYRFDDVQSVSADKFEQEAEVRKRVVRMLQFVAELMQEGAISDFSIYRSSLEQVFKSMLK